MTGMKRRTVIAVTVAVWVAAFGSAAALTYDLKRPSPVAGSASQPHLAPPVEPAPAALAKPVAEPQPVLYIPTITVVGRAPGHSAAVVTPKPVAPEVSPMRCADRRQLDMGSGGVRVCE